MKVTITMEIPDEYGIPQRELELLIARKMGLVMAGLEDKYGKVFPEPVIEQASPVR